MSTENSENPKTIIEIKKNIQSIVSKLMSNTENTENTVNTLTGEEKTLIEQISRYKVSNNLEALSNAFGNVLAPSQGSGS